jgi:hypothetical protein
MERRQFTREFKLEAGPPVRGGGGMPQRMVANSVPLSVLRITGAG